MGLRRPARSLERCPAASSTASTSLPSTISPGMPYPAAAIGQILRRASGLPADRQRELVVLADEHDGQLPCRGEVHGLVRGTLAGAPVPEEDDRRPGPVRRSLAVSAAPQACGSAGADDAVAAEDVESQVGDVHGAAEALAVSGALAEHLRHHPAEVGAPCDQVPVAAVMPDQVVAVAA